MALVETNEFGSCNVVGTYTKPQLLGHTERSYDMRRLDFRTYLYEAYSSKNSPS